MKKFLRIYDVTLLLITAFLFFIMIAILFAEVISRYFFNSPLMWAEELGRYLFIWVVYLGASQAFLQRRHLYIDVLLKLIPLKISSYIQLAIHIAIVFFLFFVFYHSISYVSLVWYDSTYSIRWIKLGWVYSVIPLGSILIIFSILRILPEFFKK